jgi:hypothetical protein
VHLHIFLTVRALVAKVIPSHRGSM